MSDYESQWRQQAMTKANLTSLLHQHKVVTAADFFEYAVDTYPDNLAVMSVDSPLKMTYSELDILANQVAHWAKLTQFNPGDVVALMMENRPEFLAITMGLAKAGITVALINTSIKEKMLFHALNVSLAKILIISPLFKANYLSMIPYFDEISSAGPCIWWHGPVDLNDPKDHPDAKKRKVTEKRFDMAISPLPKTRIDKKMRLTIKPRDPLFYIYTSGTTGVSKAAKFSHLRFIGCALTWSGPCKLTSQDRYYVPLPLFHGNGGCVAVAPCYLMGATIVLRQKFSASNFFKDIRDNQCTAAIYIGELWRYLQMLPESPEDKNHQLRVIVGNGLRPEVWENIVPRFGIELVVEHYGSTEMPGDAVLNYFNKVGSCGFVPPSVWKTKEAKIIRFDIEQERVIRNQEGLCQECSPNEGGEIVFMLPDGKYDGYIGEEVTQKKLYHNVFKQGDTWWSSGDILKIDEEGFFYFLDRAGDTFRWKGENVATSEVSQVLHQFPDIREANVYGVKIPNMDGKGGMACLSLTTSLDQLNLKALYDFVTEHLPHYAQPLFLRIRPQNVDNDKTSTLKFQKFRYSKEGFDPKSVGNDSLFFYCKTPGIETYTPLTSALFDQLCSGTFRL